MIFCIDCCVLVFLGLNKVYMVGEVLFRSVGLEGSVSWVWMVGGVFEFDVYFEWIIKCVLGIVRWEEVVDEWELYFFLVFIWMIFELSWVLLWLIIIGVYFLFWNEYLLWRVKFIFLLVMIVNFGWMINLEELCFSRGLIVLVMIDDYFVMVCWWFVGWVIFW